MKTDNNNNFIIIINVFSLLTRPRFIIYDFICTFLFFSPSWPLRFLCCVSCLWCGAGIDIKRQHFEPFLVMKTFAQTKSYE